MSELSRRVLSAIVFVPIVAGLVYAGGWALFGLVILVVGRGAWELLILAEAAGYRPARHVGVALAVALCVYLQRFGADRWFPLAQMTAVLVALLATLRHGVNRYSANALLTLGGMMYVGLLGSAPLLLARQVGDDASWLMIAIFTCIWLTDTFAYGGGRLWGQRRLAPSISPGKTVVGFVCGLVGALVPLLLISRLPSWSVLELGGLLLVVGIGGQLGDLVESAIKRDLGVKDAPSLIPGHGGMLDRFDSYFFAFPFAYIYSVTLRG
ncbi:MAG TPA: phosphatidate cytidylyltransferase [Candidatus Latescibacteria bacterium]|nr:phosphatidate cytidylyltransferase [Gemmatimonadota bacterium]HCV24150.1 phosphatidate cytidylyltransferase [Candidatus Latescibacterota bacterium]HJN29276.1 phosphatidate cytidylyltransferase [Candidatus Latescibacterota bacterium]